MYSFEHSIFIASNFYTHSFWARSQHAINYDSINGDEDHPQLRTILRRAIDNVLKEKPEAEGMANEDLAAPPKVAAWRTRWIA